MKKLLLTSALIASSLLSFAQTPLAPNGDFENWSTSSCGSVPTQYITEADYMYSSISQCPTSTGITKSTNKYSGTYALQLTTLVFMGSNVGNGLAISTGSNEGIVFNGRPTKLVGYTKFTKGGLDTLGMYVEIDDANGNKIAYNELTLSSSQSGYTKFEISLVYNPLFTSPPTTLYFGIGLGDKNGSASSNTIALIDGFSFVYPTTTGTTNYTSTSPINVYAANKNINFSENVSDVHVVDMVGANKMQETASTKTLDAATLTTGMYIVTYKYNDAYFSKKVVIE